MSDDIKKETTIDVENLRAHVVRSTKTTESERAFRCEWNIDLSTWTQEALLEKAVASIVIDAQRLYRAGQIPAEANLTRSDFEPRRKPRKASKEATAEFLQSMDPEERQAYLKEIGVL